MGRKTIVIIASVLVLIAALAVGAAYAYDNSQQGKIAEGVTIDGIDVGGMEAKEAEAKVRRQLLHPLDKPLRVSFGEKKWALAQEKLKVRADVEEAVARAVDVSHEGDLPTRIGRYLGGDELEVGISAHVDYSDSAINKFVRHIADELNREPQDASVAPAADTLEVVASHPGRKVRDVKLTDELHAAVTGGGTRTIAVKVHKTKPEVTTDEVAERYPSYLILDRSNFTLRLYRDLELARTYTVAVGAEGLETPEGTYEIQAMEEEPTWYVPESDWAGDLAGQVIPPGPDNPIKARWMAIFEGAGIHGTEETASLGSAASHGCVRMAIPDVEELYDEVEVGTPIFIG